MADTDCASESASSVCDEERVRRLFQACDANGDGYIDSHDLLSICRELSLEDCLDELMLQLGADSQGRISYEQFVQRRLALRPEIDALKGSKHTDNASDNSQGKVDSWEWDSGARDMSPVPKSLVKKATHSGKYNEVLKEDTRLAGTEIAVESGGDTNCLTTYVFNPVDTCTGTPSPEKFLKASNYELKRILSSDDDRKASETLVSPQSIAYDRKSLGHCNYMAEYDLKLKVCQIGEEHKKCCVSGHYGSELTYGHLYTISGDSKEERTYDEPYSGDLPRRSWLCCPGTQQHAEGEQPPLLASSNTPSTPGDPVTKGPPHLLCPGGCEKLQQQLDDQAQRYEEQLTELHSVIAELTRKLHQQRAMAIAEEDEVSEACTSIHDDSLTCPLEVSELEPVENDLSDIDTKVPLAESPLELPEPKLLSSNHENNELSPYSDLIEPLKQEVATLKAQLLEAQSKLANMTLQSSIQETTDDGTNVIESPESHIETDYEPKIYSNEKITSDIKYSNIVPIHKSNIKNGMGFSQAPVSKMAERIKLKRAADGHRDVNPNDLVNSDLPTAVAEHIVGDILRQCDAQSEKQAIDIEFRRLSAKLEHTRAQNSVLALTLSETKAHCDRLALLCGKYESNAIALRLALGVSGRAIEAYDVLLALLETELSLSENTQESINNRTAAEIVAKQLLSHLDSYQSTDVLLSPWQNHVYNSPTAENDEPWTTDHENRLREHVSRLKAERSNIQGTYVSLESTQVESVPVRPSSSQEARKVDLEMAVLMQELMGLREDKVELISKLFVLEKEKSAIELKLKYVEGQQKAQSAALKNLQGQLKDTEALLALATQNKERGYSDAEHAQGVELELMQALAREARLKVRLQELVSTLEQVTKNAEARLLEGREIVHDLNHTNSILAETVDRNNKKYQAKFKRMEHQMLQLVERHTAQVQTLQQRIATLETPPTNSSDNSINSMAV